MFNVLFSSFLFFFKLFFSFRKFQIFKSNSGDFKIFDKLYVDTELFGEQTVLADLQLYILNFDHKFDSRIYAIINGFLFFSYFVPKFINFFFLSYFCLGNTLVDFTISNNCTDDFLPIYDGEIGFPFIYLFIILFILFMEKH